MRENVSFPVLRQSEEERRKDSSSSGDAVVLLILLSFPVADSTSDLQVEDISRNSVSPAAAAAAAAAHLTLRLFFHGLKSMNSFASVFSQHLCFFPLPPSSGRHMTAAARRHSNRCSLQYTTSVTNWCGRGLMKGL